VAIVLAGLALALSCAPQDPKTGDDVRIHLARDGWGEADPSDITKVLESAGAALWGQAPGKGFPTLEVSRTQGDPVTLFKRGPSGAIRIMLNVEGRHWSQFAFQFGHEVGHVLCGFADYPNPNLWFEETICEAASLFTLGRMAKAWETAPPYPNWKGYAASLLKYRNDRLVRSKLPEGKSLSGWFREHEESLRKDPRQRDENLRLAAALLPLFEEEPGRWSAVGTLNSVRGDGSRPFAQYLRDWTRSAPEKHRPFIHEIADRLGVPLDP
jgi:hypothetical protein